MTGTTGSRDDCVAMTLTSTPAADGAALAALLGGHYQPRADERVAVVVSGGNTPPLF